MPANNYARIRCSQSSNKLVHLVCVCRETCDLNLLKADMTFMHSNHFSFFVLRNKVNIRAFIVINLLGNFV